ncbi:hypothetical protein V6N12_047343 [Hibiscus sabdariffa]|uniref:Uncharacterized protein n=1 Tax=Hibiscus sabdariffa TaxID=183260 RepID=A0ABR2DDG2_9ROSI
MVDLCQKFHQVLDRLPTTIDTEVDKQPIESSDDPSMFRLLVMERMVDLCQKFHQVLDRLPTTIDTEVDKKLIESSDDPSMFRLLVMERMMDLCDGCWTKQG